MQLITRSVFLKAIPAGLRRRHRRLCVGAAAVLRFSRREPAAPDFRVGNRGGRRVDHGFEVLLSAG